MLAGKALGLTDALMVSGVGIVVVMAELALLAVLVFLLSRLVSAMVNKKAVEEISNDEADCSEYIVTANSSAAQTSCVQLYGVDEQTAATIMAIVSKESGIPLDRLSFKSIRKVEE